MNKVCIAGHSASSLQQLESLLQQCGMQPPLPSRRDGMTPRDITQALLKAHQCEPVELVTEESALAPIQAGPVWHGMALDLLLGNLDQPFWGWADPNTIYLLEYWRELDPHLVFVLVYDHPANALRQWADTQGAATDLSEVHLRNALDNWSAYNGALLRFYLRHPDRCLLFSAEHMHQALDAYLQQMGQKLKRPQLLCAPESAAALIHASTPNLPAPLHSAAGLLGSAPEDVATLWQVPAMESYLIEDVLKRYPAAVQLYAELQSAASLPPAHTPAHKANPALAWQAFLQHRQAVVDTLAHLIDLQERSAAQVRQLLEQNKTADQSKEVAEKKAENELLLNQLHQVQEELERMFLAKQTEATSNAELQQKLQAETQARRQEATAKAEALKQLEALKATTAQHETTLAETQEENELLLNQLHQVQEELERYYLENQKLKAAANAKPAKPKHYGAADRIKQQLTYRLGARVIQQNQTFWGKVWLLPALWSEARAFKRDQALRADQKLPPIHQYADAHEAERAQQHLSYRLGLVVRRAGYNPFKWPMLPFALHAAAKAWKQENGHA